MSDRRLAENEVFFRQSNEKIAQGFVELKEMAEAEGHSDWLDDTDQPVQFFCECCDEDCRKRIEMKSSKYLELHKNSSQFIVLPGHDVAKIEHVLKAGKDYTIVEKYITPPKKVSKPNKTNLDKS